MRAARCLETAEIGLYSVVVTMPSSSAMATGGTRNCQTETPAALATTSSSFRVRLRKANMAPNSTEKGKICSVMVGTRSSDRNATPPVVAPLASPERRSSSTKSLR